MKKILVTTPQRCGSTWLCTISKMLCGQKYPAKYIPGVPFNLLDFTTFNDEGVSERIQNFSDQFRQYSDESVFKTHDLPIALVPEFLKQNQNFVVLSIKRDFRDVLISRINYNRHYLPSRGRPIESEYIRDHSELSDNELVTKFIFKREFCDWLTIWKLFTDELNHERFRCLCYEDMLGEEGLGMAVRAVWDCASDMGETISLEMIDRVVSRTQFDKICVNSEKDRSEREVKDAFCRKGIAGDYKNYLTVEEAEQISLLMR